GVLDRNKLVVPSIDLADRRVQRGGLTTAGWPGDQDHPVWLGDRAPEAPEIVLAEAEAIQAQGVDPRRNRFTIQNANHHGFAVRARQNRYAEIDRLVVH